MLTCKKTYFDIPFAHRQHLHDGHCSFIHGHNWDISLTFACEQTDENGFVVDFGKVKFIKQWIDEHLDHACVFSSADSDAKKLVEASSELWKVYFVEQCSCEGLAMHLFDVFNKLVKQHTNSRVRVIEIEVSEDSKNTATFKN